MMKKILCLLIASIAVVSAMAQTPQMMRTRITISSWPLPIVSGSITESVHFDKAYMCSTADFIQIPKGEYRVFRGKKKADGSYKFKTKFGLIFTPIFFSTGTAKETGFATIVSTGNPFPLRKFSQGVYLITDGKVGYVLHILSESEAQYVSTDDHFGKTKACGVYDEDGFCQELSLPGKKYCAKHYDAYLERCNYKDADGKRCKNKRHYDEEFCEEHSK